ncbi:MAG TPA: hypothetical protein V6D26_26400 [Stenomitos sp.]
MQLIKRPTQPQTEEPGTLTIPANLPSVVRSVAESLILRDPDSAKRYLALYQKRGD